MTCLTPYTIKNPKLRRKPEDLYINVPCGKCVACLKRRAATWVFRLKQEEKISKNAAFITYTYTDQEVPNTLNGFLTLDKTHHTKYMKRLRKQLKKEGYTEKLKYYLVGEYGGQTERPHYHAIMYNLPDKYQLNEHYIEKVWGHGRVQIDEVTGRSIAYVCGYVNKQTFFSNMGDYDDRQKEFNFMSKGLGLNYLSKAVIKSMKTKMKPYLTVEGGQKMSMPRYFREKVFTDQEKTTLAKKAIEHIEDNVTFANDTEKQNYIKNEAYLRKRKANKNRKKL